MNCLNNLSILKRIVISEFNILHGNKNNLTCFFKVGQIYITDDSLEVYYDLDDTNRYNLSSIYSVGSLPESPISNKIYLLTPSPILVRLSELEL